MGKVWSILSPSIKIMNTDTITETIKWHLLSLWKVETLSKVMEAMMKFQ